MKKSLLVWSLVCSIVLLGGCSLFNKNDEVSVATGSLNSGDNVVLLSGSSISGDISIDTGTGVNTGLSIEDEKAVDMTVQKLLDDRQKEISTSTGSELTQDDVQLIQDIIDELVSGANKQIEK